MREVYKSLSRMTQCAEAQSGKREWRNGHVDATGSIDDELDRQEEPQVKAELEK